MFLNSSSPGTLCTSDDDHTEIRNIFQKIQVVLRALSLIPQLEFIDKKMPIKIHIPMLDP